MGTSCIVTSSVKSVVIVSSTRLSLALPYTKFFFVEAFHQNAADEHEPIYIEKG